MNPAKTATIIKEMHKMWPADAISDEGVIGYSREIHRFDFDTAMAALLSLSREGRERMPPPGVVVARIMEMTLDAPSWGEVKAMLMKREAERERRRVEGFKFDWVCPDGVCDGSGQVVDESARLSWHCTCRQAMIEARRGDDLLHPLVREFELEFITADEVHRMMSKGDTTVEAQMREKWRAFVADRVRQSVLIGVSAPVRQVQRANHDVHSPSKAIHELVGALAGPDTPLLEA